MVVAVGLAGAALMGCGSEASAEWDEDAPVDAAAGSGIEFGDCPALADGATRDPRLTCGTIGVPLDHRDPDGPCHLNVHTAGHDGLDAVAQLGGFMARTMLGAKRETGLAEMDRALRLGGNRALFPAMAALTRIQTDRGDIAAARTLAQAATTGATPTGLDRMLQRAAAAVLVPLRQNDGRGAQALAARLLPFGRLQ